MRVDFIQAGRISDRLITLGNRLSDFDLLLRRQLRAVAPQSAHPRGQHPNRLGSPFEHGPFELRESPDHLHPHSTAGVVVSIASVRLRNPAPASPNRSMIVSTSRRERDSRSSFQTTSTSTFGEKAW